MVSLCTILEHFQAELEVSSSLVLSCSKLELFLLLIVLVLEYLPSVFQMSSLSESDTDRCTFQCNYCTHMKTVRRHCITYAKLPTVSVLYHLLHIKVTKLECSSLLCCQHSCNKLS